MRHIPAFLFAAATTLTSSNHCFAGPLVQTHPEVEPNDTIATAQSIPAFPPFTSQIVIGDISPGDVDYFQITLPAPISILVALMTLPPGVETHHLSLGFFDGAGMPLEISHALAPSASFFYPELTMPGAYYLGVSGFSDIPFSGAHTESFEYHLIFGYNFVPGPGALPLLIGAALCAPHRRRRDRVPRAKVV